MPRPTCRHPHIHVNIAANTGGGLARIKAVQAALRAHGVADAQIEEFFTEATSGDHEHMLATCAKWVDIR